MALPVHEAGVLAPSAARKVVAFWASSQANWFTKDQEFDALLRDRLADAHEAARARALAAWEQTPQGCLALLILLDQYPRNAFRGKARMYATDPMALTIARRAVPMKVPANLRVFMILPFAHSEDLADQETSVSLHHRHARNHLEEAEGHRDIILRFGQFPHRNAILKRPTSPAAAAYLRSGGFRG